MNKEPAADPQPRFEVRVTPDSHVAWARTRLAVERTMMATASPVYGIFTRTAARRVARMPERAGLRLFFLAAARSMDDARAGAAIGVDSPLNMPRPMRTLGV
jgi:hypothetical protein